LETTFTRMSDNYLRSIRGDRRSNPRDRRFPRRARLTRPQSLPVEFRYFTTDSASFEY
jgi:hypothetical protein